MGTGCFWCVEHDFEKVEGVLDVVSGYSAGTNENPTYENYDDNGHREVVQVTYDPTIVSYGNLVEHVIKYGDPTDGDGSFYDRGVEYAPVIHYVNEWEKQEAGVIIARIDALKVYEKPIAIDVVPIKTFWPAEEYHQDYAEKNTVKYNYYRLRSGRTAFIEKHWGKNAGVFVASTKPTVDEENGGSSEVQKTQKAYQADSWKNFVKPTEEKLKTMLTPLQYKVTQEEGTESPYNNTYDKNYEEGIYVDIVSGEPLYFSKDKFDSGTGWPSFVKPITDDVVVLTEDNGLFAKRTEVRSRYADSHIGHVFDDGPADRGGKRYCMNSAAMRFIEKADMEKEGYGYLLSQV
jgi:peptide methionine sulfoxide reductase msrA/msrB